MTAIMSRSDLVRRIEMERVIAVVRMSDPSAGRDVAAALVEGGISAIEITMTVPRAVDVIAELSRLLPDGLIGAGTVMDAATAHAVITAGAKFVVSPVFRQSIIEACHQRDVVACPGCFTPTEIADAWEAGADIIKVFPSTSLGPTYFKDLRGPFPSIKLMPTGGVTKENAADWIRAGAIAVGASSALVDPKAIEAKNYSAITANARAFVAAVQGAR